MATNEQDLPNISTKNDLLNLLIKAYLKGEQSNINTPKEFIDDILPQLQSMLRSNK